MGKIVNLSLYIASIILVVVGGYIWFTQDVGTKLFELSNDIIGAGLLIAIGTTVALVIKSTKN
tara:strand:- start:296 stop:484 length:189 start_codon:yes stop_codon:yes gene_type:complete